MHDELDRLDRLLKQLRPLLEVPGEEEDDSPEWVWQKLDLLEAAAGPEALRAMLRRQSISHASIDEILLVLIRRREALE